SDVPVCQSSETIENEPGKENPMFVVLREEIGHAEGAVRHFFKERSGAVPLIQNGEIDTIFEDEKADQERWRKDQHSLDKSGDRFGQHSTQLTLPLERKKRAKLPAEGIEPTRSCDHWILSPARLPVPPRRRAELKLQKGSPSSSCSRCPRAVANRAADQRSPVE